MNKARTVLGRFYRRKIHFVLESEDERSHERHNRFTLVRLWHVHIPNREIQRVLILNEQTLIWLKNCYENSVSTTYLSLKFNKRIFGIYPWTVFFYRFGLPTIQGPFHEINNPFTFNFLVPLFMIMSVWSYWFTFYCMVNNISCTLRVYNDYPYI